MKSDDKVNNYRENGVKEGRNVVGRMIDRRKAKRPKLISKPPLLYIAFYVWYYHQKKKKRGKFVIRKKGVASLMMWCKALQN